MRSREAFSTLAASGSPRVKVSARRSRTGLSLLDQMASKAARSNLSWLLSHLAASARTFTSLGGVSVPKVKVSRERDLSAARAGAAIPSRAAERTASPHPVLLSIQEPPLGLAKAPTAEPSTIPTGPSAGASTRAPIREDELPQESYRTGQGKGSAKGPNLSWPANVLC